MLYLFYIVNELTQQKENIKKIVKKINYLFNKITIQEDLQHIKTVKQEGGKLKGQGKSKNILKNQAKTIDNRKIYVNIRLLALDSLEC